MDPSSNNSEPDTMTELAVAAMNAAVRKVLEQHRRDNSPLAVWQNGRVVWLDPHTMQEVHEDIFRYGSAKIAGREE
jgi:hypothetical protein